MRRSGRYAGLVDGLGLGHPWSSEEVADVADDSKDVKLTGKDKDGKLDKILGAGSNPKNK